MSGSFFAGDGSNEVGYSTARGKLPTVQLGKCCQLDYQIEAFMFLSFEIMEDQGHHYIYESIGLGFVKSIFHPVVEKLSKFRFKDYHCCK